MDKTAAAAEINAVTVNLPTFWREQPELWFAQAEGQFRLRGITDENAKFDHVITSLDAITVANVSNLMRNRPTTTPYTRLRQRLAHIYELSDRERADRPLDIGHLGDQKPLELANKMLNMLEDRCKFSRNLPLSSGGTEKSARLLHHQNLNCVSS